MIYTEVITLSGAKKPKISLPQKIFGAKPNQALLTQAVRVYLSNQRRARAKTKTRGEVLRTGAKWFRQKGTGRARHGARSAPIFVGGGRAHGPTGEQNYKMALSKKMRRQALASALSAKAKEKEIIVVEELEKAKKTKEIAKMLEKIKSAGGKSLLVLHQKLENVALAVRNIPGLRLTSARSLNAYEILRSGKILITREAIKILEEQWSKD